MGMELINLYYARYLNLSSLFFYTSMSRPPSVISRLRGIPGEEDIYLTTTPIQRLVSSPLLDCFLRVTVNGIMADAIEVNMCKCCAMIAAC